MALNQQDIDVGAAPNDGQGDPIRTAFIKCNDNFTQLYSLPNPTPPTTLVGAPGDMPGMYAYDDTYFYYCYAPYNGISTVWGQLVQSDESIPSIGNGLSNVVIAFANANVTIGVNGTGNVGVFSPAGLTVRGAANSNTVTTGSLIAGNFAMSGDTITSVGETITITPAGNVIFGDVVVNAGFSILGTTTTTEAPVIVLANTAANATVANGAGIQVSQGNFASITYNSANLRWNISPRVETSSIYINSPTGNGNIFGAFNIAATNVVSANHLFSTAVFTTDINADVILSNVLFANSLTSNKIAGDAGFVSNVAGANVTGMVALANVSLFSNATTFSTFANIANTVSNPLQPNITTVGTLNYLTVAGNLAGNVAFFTNSISATVIGRSLTNPFGMSVLQGQIGANSNAQPNITQLGALVDLTVNGDLRANSDVYVTGNLYGANVFGNISGAVELAQFVTKSNQSNITAVGVLSNLTMANTGVISGANAVYANTFVANAGIGAPIIGRSVANPFGMSVLQGQLGANSNAQPNVTSLGNLVSVNVDGNAVFGTAAGNSITISGNTVTTGGVGTTLNLGYNVIIPGNLQVQGNTTTVNSNTVAINDLTFVVANNASTASLADGAGLFVGPEPAHYAGLFYLSTPNTWNFDLPLSVSGNINSTGNVNSNGVTATGNITTSASMSATGNINSGASINSVGNIYAPSFNWANGNPVISSSGNLSTATISSTGNISSLANVNAAGASFTGNVTAAYFEGIATSAQYADLAENYLADEAYAPGTVLSHGGSAEVTISLVDADPLVIGVVSSNPAYLMNSKLAGRTVVPVAFTGRIPCRVQGPITRGAMLVSNGDGRARAEANPAIGTVIGKALESFDGDLGVIEIVVGKL